MFVQEEVDAWKNIRFLKGNVCVVVIQLEVVRLQPPRLLQ